MATNKKRVNIAVGEETLEALRWLAKKRARPLATLSLELLEQALELQEDLHFSRIAEQRLQSKSKRVSHAKAWG